MKIMLTDDHAVVRQGLKALLEQQAGVEVVGEADNGETAVNLLKRLLPDVVIMDIAMPRLNGVEVIRHINRFYPTIKTVILSMHSDNNIVQTALKAGCHAYVSKSSHFTEIIAALHAVSNDEHYLSPEIREVVINKFLHPGSNGEGAGIELLTDRERQVLQLVAEGFSVKEIARDLHVSSKTIDNTRRNIMEKLDQHSVVGLTKLAIRAGLTSLAF
jgi:DNA-binding NarL/FixJ family response regulator